MAPPAARPHWHRPLATTDETDEAVASAGEGREGREPIAPIGEADVPVAAAREAEQR